MRITGKTIAAVTAACTIAAAAVTVAGTASAASTAKRTGTSFVASTAQGGVQIVLSRDGRQIRSALFAYEQKCTDGDTTYDYDLYRAIPVAANRKFSYSLDSGPQASTATPGATFSITQSFKGTVNKAGTKIVGTAKSTFTFADPAGASYTCDTGTVQFKAAD